MRMLRLHHLGEVLLVNPAHIQTVYKARIRAAVTMGKIEMEDYGEEHGSYIYIAGEDDAVHVDENLDTIDRLISLG